MCSAIFELFLFAMVNNCKSVLLLFQTLIITYISLWSAWCSICCLLNFLRLVASIRSKGWRCAGVDYDIPYFCLIYSQVWVLLDLLLTLIFFFWRKQLKTSSIILSCFSIFLFENNICLLNLQDFLTNMLYCFWSSWRAWLLPLPLRAIHTLFDKCFWCSFIWLRRIWIRRSTWHILLHSLQPLADEHTVIISHYQLDSLILFHFVLVCMTFATGWLLFPMLLLQFMPVLKVFLLNHLVPRNLVLLNILLSDRLPLHGLNFAIFPMICLCFFSRQPLQSFIEIIQLLVLWPSVCISLVLLWHLFNSCLDICNFLWLIFTLLLFLIVMSSRSFVIVIPTLNCDMQVSSCITDFEFHVFNLLFFQIAAVYDVIVILGMFFTVGCPWCIVFARLDNPVCVINTWKEWRCVWPIIWAAGRTLEEILFKLEAVPLLRIWVFLRLVDLLRYLLLIIDLDLPVQLRLV